MPEDTPLIIGLAQVNNSFSGQHYLPYSIGLLQAYAQRVPEIKKNTQFLPLLYKRQPIREMVEALQSAHIVGFSTYVWNNQISLEAARRLKVLNPDQIIIFGGPHVPDNCEEYLRQYPFIDIAVHGEGEQTFSHLLEELLQSRELKNVSGISYLDKGTFIFSGRRDRLKSLDEVPSPFLEGIFDEIMATEANTDNGWIGLWETNRGCPFQCTFCDWGSATAAKVNKFDLQRLNKEIDWFSDNKIEFIFCCDANFGILPRDVEIVTKVAEVKERTGYPKALSVQNTKNAAERAYKTQKILSDAGLNKGVALSMQSVDEATLKNIKRSNISLDTYFDLMNRFTKDGVETYSDLILALPGETYQTFIEGVDLLINSGQHNRIQFNNLSILPNAEMANPAYRKEHEIETVESNIINIHGALHALEDDILEKQDLIIATKTMPKEAWREVRAFSWMAAFLYFDKMFQIPLLVASDLGGISFSKLFDSFLNADPNKYPTLSNIAEFFRKSAEDIQNGGPEYTFSEKWLGIYWPADEYIFLKLTDENTLDKFYVEAESLVVSLVGSRINLAPLQDSIKLNHALVKQPFVTENKKVELEHNILSYYLGRRIGQNPTLETSPTVVEINSSNKTWDDFNRWATEVVWWGNKKGAYLYTNDSVEKQIAGIF
ncbi:MAG: radical SAM protein [Rhodospirillales bacterium]|nr:radical SAM protein [Rhodospirillales bacterium]